MKISWRRIWIYKVNQKTRNRLISFSAMITLTVMGLGSSLPLFLRSKVRADAITNHIVINEVMAFPNTGEIEWIELYNPTPDTAVLDGWRINDGSSNFSGVFPSGTVIPSGGFLVREAPSTDSKLNNTTKELRLQSDTSGTLVDSVLYSGIAQGKSYARSFDASNTWAAQVAPTKGVSNGLVPSTPEITSCATTQSIKTTDLSTWSMSETRTNGHNELVTNGLHVWTDSNTSLDKAAGYYYFSAHDKPNLLLKDVCAPSIDIGEYTGGRPSMQLSVDRNGNGMWYGNLVYEPWAYGDGNWWSSKNFGINGGMGYESFGTLQDFLNSNPDTQILAVGYSLGSELKGNAIINNLTAGDTMYTFGIVQTPELNTENFNTVNDTTYKGISIGFNAKDFGVVSGVTVDLERADGSHIVKHGAQGIKDLLSNKTTPTQATTPFVIHEGTFRESEDKDVNGNLYWSPAPPTVWNASTTPVRATITVTGDNGEKSVTNNLFSQGNPSWPTYDSTLLPIAPTLTVTTPAENGLASTRKNSNKLKISGVFSDDIAANYATFQLVKDGVSVAIGTLYGYGSVYNPAATYAAADDSYVFDLPVPANLASGEYSLFYIGTDFDGGITGRMERKFVIDNDKPVINIVQPAGNSYNPSEIIVDATDNLSLKTVTSHIYNQANTTLEKPCSKSVTPVGAMSYTLICPISGLGDGVYAIRANAQDTADNTSSTVTLQFTIDHTAPAPPTNLGWKTTTDINVPDNGFTNIYGGSASWAASASGDVSHYVYKYWNDIPSDQYNSLANAWTTSTSTTNMGGVFNRGEGTHHFCIIAADMAGNESVCSPTFTVTYDKTAPSIPVIIAPLAEQYFNTTPILNSWIASTDSTSGVKGYQVAYLYDDNHTFSGSTCEGEQIDGKTLSGCRDANNTARSHTPNPTEQGGVMLWVRAVDTAGNKSDWSEPVHYFYDITAPEVPSLVGPDDNSTQPNGFNFAWSAVNDQSGVTYDWRSSLSGETNNSDNSFSDPLPYPHNGLTVTSLFEGNSPEDTYFWQVRACDGAGNCSNWSGPWKVTISNSNDVDTEPQVQGVQTSIPSDTLQGSNNPPDAPQQPKITMALVNGGGGVPGNANRNSGANGANTVENTDSEDKNKPEVAAANVLADSFFDNDNGKASDTAETKTNSACNKLMGLCWRYWPPIVIGVVALVYISYRNIRPRDI